MILIWDYLHPANRHSELHSWADAERLGKRERAKLNQKLDMVERAGFETSCQLGLVAGTSGDNNHIFKLVVHAERMLRPMLCRGPASAHGEITLLCGAIEKDFRLHPATAALDAENNRLELKRSVGSGRELRASHERF